MSEKFSVLMSVYYKEKPEYLKEAIDSILNQTVPPTEIVIVKDGKLTEELDGILSAYAEKDERFRVIGYDKNRGLGLALKYGVENCKYDIIARMDSDDISMPDRFEKELPVFIEGNYDIVGCITGEFTGTIDNVQCRRIPPETDEEIKEFIRTRNPFVHPSVMLKKSSVLAAGNFRDMYLCEDYDMWLRMVANGCRCYNIQEYLVYMRVDDNFYDRRGGLKYCREIVKFKRLMYKSKYIGFKNCVKSSLATIVVSLMPSKMRRNFYKKFLRK